MDFEIYGRLSKEPEARTTQSGEVQSTFTMAEDKKFSENETNFFRIICWGKRAEYINKHLKKGNRLFVKGHIDNNNYKDKDGVMHYQDSYIADEIKDVFDWYVKSNDDSQDTESEYYPPASADGNSIPF